MKNDQFKNEINGQCNVQDQWIALNCGSTSHKDYMYRTYIQWTIQQWHYGKYVKSEGQKLSHA